MSYAGSTHRRPGLLQDGGKLRARARYCGDDERASTHMERRHPQLA